MVYLGQVNLIVVFHILLKSLFISRQFVNYFLTECSTLFHYCSSLLAYVVAARNRHLERRLPCGYWT